MKHTKLKGKTRLSLEGEVTVNDAVKFKEHLVDLFQQGDAVEIDFTDVTEVDLSCLQLLCSAHRSAISMDKTLTIVSPAVSPLLETRTKAGFVFHNSCPLVRTDECLWGGG